MQDQVQEEIRSYTIGGDSHPEPIPEEIPEQSQQNEPVYDYGQ